MQQPASFADVLQAVGQLSSEDQIALVDIVRRRVAEVERKRLCDDLLAAIASGSNAISSQLRTSARPSSRPETTRDDQAPITHSPTPLDELLQAFDQLSITDQATHVEVVRSRVARKVSELLQALTVESQQDSSDGSNSQVDPDELSDEFPPHTQAESRKRDRATIELLYCEHRSARFPTRSRGRELAGHDLIALDYSTAGCVDTFLDRGSLDTWRLAVLGLCYHGLALVVPQLEGEERPYFCRLETLAGLALEATRDGSQAT